MEVIFEILNAKQFVPKESGSKTFKQSGGAIGRGEECEWMIPDRKRHLSNRHAVVSYRDGQFFLTDISSNGIQAGPCGVRMRKGEPQRIEHGSVYVVGDFEIRARLVHASPSADREIGRPQASVHIIPDDAFFDLDPLKTLEQYERKDSETDELMALDAPAPEPEQRADYARIDVESLLVPMLIAPPQEAAATEQVHAQRQSEGFWERFGIALGVDLQDLDHDSREALAINAARLLNTSVGGLQQSLRTRSELKNEMRLALTTVQGGRKNPLKFGMDAGETLDTLLQGNKPGQLSADQAISRAYDDLQAHQVALLAASRAAVRGSLQHFSPQQLALRFERDNKSLLATDGSRWRAYNRYHQTLCQDDDWSERLLARDFAQVYEDQVRLICALHIEPQG